VIVVTGGAGFIGGNLVADLVAGGREVVVVDELRRASAEGRVPRGIRDALDKDEFVTRLEAGDFDPPRCEAVVHLGACTDTTERDEGYLLRNNVQYSERLLAWALARRVPFLYASSAAVYGHGPWFVDVPGYEAPLSGYARSKWLFDQRVRAVLAAASSQVLGLRYFNVYGPGEAHKGAMASMVFRLHATCRAGGPVRLFGASHGWAAGEQRRDFVDVADAVAVARWFLERPDRSGIFNVGTGTSTSFNELARLVLSCCGGDVIEYVPMPPAVHEGYQSYTCADLSALRRVGYDTPFQPLAVTVPEYLRQLDAGARAGGEPVRAFP
jgi:ADP-L-glycero-D-manno-heptose 6-epimerase